ncbi:MAG: succinate dehydrogenase, cytochrome b556 subunit [Rhodobacterales bacterium]|nr:MAG: succinate dehydrogenase, cytochrome b556 subunit [Rhodobacterales bacterium]
MADANRGNRPLSPHLTIYRWQIAMFMSILNRITGMAMIPCVILIVWWFVAAATGQAHFEFVDWLATSWLGLLLLFCTLWAFWVHLFNGLRHLAWDLAWWMEMPQVNKSGWTAIVMACVVNTIFIYILLVGV